MRDGMCVRVASRAQPVTTAADSNSTANEGPTMGFSISLGDSGRGDRPCLFHAQDGHDGRPLSKGRPQAILIRARGSSSPKSPRAPTDADAFLAALPDTSRA
jgi:hypothetical protein